MNAITVRTLRGSACALAALLGLSCLALATAAQAQQDLRGGPIVLRPPPGATAGQEVFAGGSVIVNLDALNRAAPPAYPQPAYPQPAYPQPSHPAPAYPPQAYPPSPYPAAPYPAAPYPPAPYALPGMSGAPAPSYLARPPLPGEVPLRDQDPVVLRPPGPDGYGSGRPAEPAIAVEPLPPPPAQRRPAAERPADRPAPAQSRSPAEPARSAAAAPAEPPPKPQPRPEPRPQPVSSPQPEPKPEPAPQLVTSETAPTQATAQAPASEPAGSSATQAAAAQDAPSPGPVLRSQVREPQVEEDAPLPEPAAPARAAAAAQDAPGTGSQDVAAATPSQVPAPAAAGRSEPAVPLPAPRTARPQPVEPQAAPPQPSQPQPAAQAPSQPAAQPAPQQTASVEAPARTLPAVTGEDGTGLTIAFAGGAASLDPAAEQALAALAERLQDGSERLQIKAYAEAPEGGSASGARRLSLSRALAVRSFLIDRGIRSTRIDVRALGDTGTGPLDRVEIAVSERP